MNFKKWLETYAVYDGTQGTYNWWGSVNNSTGRSIEGYPIGTKEDKKPKKKKKKK
jgi:hypothetical protein